VAATSVSRDDVIQREVLHLVAAVLAGVPVTDEHLAPGELHSRAGSADVVLQPDDGGRAEDLPRRSHLLVVELDHFRLLAEHEAEGAREVTDVQRLVIHVEHEHDSVHGGARIAGGALAFRERSTS